MALELTNKPLAGRYTITGAGETLGRKQIFNAKDPVGQAVLLCSLSRSELAACTPLIGASQHPNVLPILDKLDDQGILAAVLPEIGQSNVSPSVDNVYSIITQLIDGMTWLAQRGFPVSRLGSNSVAIMDSRPVLRDYFLSHEPDEESQIGLSNLDQDMVYAICSWSLRALPGLADLEPELHDVLNIGASFLPTDRWQNLSELATQLAWAFQSRNKRVVSANKTVGAIAACCGIALLGLRELSWQLLNGL